MDEQISDAWTDLDHIAGKISVHCERLAEDGTDEEVALSKIYDWQRRLHDVYAELPTIKG